MAVLFNNFDDGRPHPEHILDIALKQEGFSQAQITRYSNLWLEEEVIEHCDDKPGYFRLNGLPNQGRLF